MLTLSLVTLFVASQFGGDYTRLDVHCGSGYVRCHHDEPVTHMCHDDKGNPNVRLYDINAGSQSNPVHVFEGHKGNVTCFSFDQQSQWMVTGGEDGTLKVWDTRYRVEGMRREEHRD